MGAAEDSVPAVPGDGLFAFERLDVWQYARDFAVLCIRLTESLPRGRGGFADQLRRSCIATMQGIAEGAGRMAPRDKAHRYTSAKAECDEAVSHLAVLSALGDLDEALHQEARRLAGHITRMLIGLIRRWRSRA